MRRAELSSEDLKRTAREVSKLPPNAQKISLALSTLPIEIIHLVLDNPPINIILDWATYHTKSSYAYNSYLHQCLLSYLPFKNVFSDVDNIHNVIWMWLHRQSLIVLRGLGRQEQHCETLGKFREGQSQIQYRMKSALEGVRTITARRLDVFFKTQTRPLHLKLLTYCAILYSMYQSIVRER